MNILNIVFNKALVFTAVQDKSTNYVRAKTIKILFYFLIKLFDWKSINQHKWFLHEKV